MWDNSGINKFTPSAFPPDTSVWVCSRQSELGMLGSSIWRGIFRGLKRIERPVEK